MILTLSCLILLASCRDKESEYTAEINLFKNLTYAIDTLVVDPKGEIININNGMQYFDLSADKTLLFLYDRQQTI